MKDKIVGVSLKQNSQIKNVLKQGLTIFGDVYVLKYTNSNQKFEFAISTNKKIFRTAVITKLKDK